MAYYRCLGTVPQKQMTKLQHTSGRFIHEELVSTKGFVGAYSFLYRLNAPTRLRSIDPIPGHELVAWDNGAIVRNLFDVNNLKSEGDFFEARRPMLFNDTLIYCLARVTEGMGQSFYRNPMRDELVLVAKGSGTLRTSYGKIEYRELDLIYIPRTTTIQWLPAAGEELLIVLESADPIVPPSRYRADNGQLLFRGPYKERDLRGPELEEPIDEIGEFSIAVRTADAAARLVVERHPFDVVGWDGTVYPFALNLDDVEPIEGHVHVTPDQGEVFSSGLSAICVNVPRRTETHPLSMPYPPHHDNVDYDEIVFPVPRPGPDQPPNPRAGKLWIHGRAFPHGGPPGFENFQVPDAYRDYSFMLDAAQPMRLTTIAQDIDVPDYATTFWR